jgi:hypothetical protein
MDIRKCYMPSSIMGTVFLRIFIFLLGLIMAVPAVNILYTYYNYRCQGEVTYGIVDHPSSGRGLGGRPLIQYEDSFGKVHEFKSKAKTHWFRTPKKGERIKVFFDKNEPQKAIADSLIYYLLLPLIFFATGCYCCIYVVFLHKENKPKSTTVSVRHCD